MVRSRRCVIPLVIMGLPVSALGQTTYTWVGTDGGSWSDPNNWSPAQVPVANTDGTNNIVIAATTPLQVVPDYTYWSGGFNTLTISGPVTMENGAGLKVFNVNVSGATLSQYEIDAERGSFTNVDLTDEKVSLLSGSISGTVENQSVIYGSVPSIEVDGLIKDSTISGINDVYVNGTILDSSIGGDIATVTSTDIENSSIWGNYWTDVDPPSGSGAQVTITGSQIYANDNIGFGGPATCVFEDSTAIGEIATIGSQTVYENSGSMQAWNLSVYGTLDNEGSITCQIHATISGTLDLISGVMLSVSGETISGTLSQTGGMNEPNNGAPTGLNIVLGGTYILAGGSLSIPSQFRPTFLNAGTFAIDEKNVQPSQISLPIYSQSASGLLEIIAAVPSQTGIFDPSLSAALAGTFELEFDSSYVPAVGDIFTIVQTPSVTGTFSSYLFPDLPEDWYFVPMYTPTSFSVTIVPEPRIGAIVVLLLAKRRRR